MAHEIVTLQESPLETERLLGAAAFGDTIDMSVFEAAYSAPNAQIPDFNSFIAEEPEMAAAPTFQSFLDEEDISFNSFV